MPDTLTDTDAGDDRRPSATARWFLLVLTRIFICAW